MTVKEVLQQLEELGTEKMRAQNRRHGAGDNQFGVRMGDIRKVAKQIKNNLELGVELWESGIIEAQMVAILIMKPKELSVEQLDKMVREMTFTWVADWFNSYLVKKHPENERLRKLWMQAEDPMAARAGWNLTSIRIAKKDTSVDLPAILDRIEAEMKEADPLVQWTMNFALVEAGINHPEYRKRALEIGEKLELYKDFPVSKGCTSPFAPIWINEMVSRQAKEV